MARVIDPFLPFLDNDSNIASGWSLEFFESGSSTVHKDTFSDSSLTIANPNVIPIGIDGRLERDCFGEGDYRVLLRNTSGSTVRSYDPITAAGGGGGGGGSSFGADWSVSANYNIADVVRDSNRYWQAQRNNSGQRPSLDTTGNDWREILFTIEDPNGPPMLDNEPVFKYRTNTGPIPASGSSTFNWQFFDPSANNGNGALVDRPFTRVVNGLASGTLVAAPQGFTVTAFTNSTVTVRNDDTASPKNTIVFGFGY